MTNLTSHILGTPSLIIASNPLGGANPDDLRVNGSLATPVRFTIEPDPIADIFFSEIRFHGSGSGIKFGKFLSLNNELTNGIQVNIQTDGEILFLPPIKSTDDFKHDFTFGNGLGFPLHIQAGNDNFLATLKFTVPITIRKLGDITPDDFIEILIQDDLTAASIKELRFTGFGFKRKV